MNKQKQIDSIRLLEYALNTIINSAAEERRINGGQSWAECYVKAAKIVQDELCNKKSLLSAT